MACSRLLILCIVFGANSFAIASGTTAHVGVYLPLTEELYNGTRLPYRQGREVVVATVVGLIHANERYGGIVPELGSSFMSKCPLEFEYSIHDTRLHIEYPVIELVNAEKNDRHPDAVIGPLLTDSARTFSLVARSYGIPVVSPSVSSSEFNDKHIFPNLVRIHISDEDSAHALAEFLHEINAEYVAIIYDELNVGAISYRESLAKELRQYGITSVPFPAFDEQSLKFEVQEIVDHKLNIVVSIIDDVESLLLVADSMDWVGEGKLFIFTENVTEDELLDLMRKDSRFAELLNGSVRISPIAGVPGHGRFDELRNEWTSFSQYLEEINSHLPGGSLSHELTNMTIDLDTSVFSDLTSDVAVAAYDAAVTTAIALCKQCDSEGECDFNFRGFVDSIVNASFEFEGASGIVHFDETCNRRPDSYAQLLENFVTNSSSGTLEIIFAGHWVPSADQWAYDEALHYAGGRKDPPRFTDEIPTEYNYIKAWERALVNSFAILVYCLLSVICVWMCIYKEDKIVKASQPVFLYVVLFGIGVSTGAVFSLGIDDNVTSDMDALDFHCMFPVWLWSMGTTLLTSALLVKFYRIMKVFNNKHLKRVIITVRDMLFVVLILFSFNVLILMLWQLLAPWRWHRETIEIDIFDKVIETAGSCSADSGKNSVPFICVLVLYHLALFFLLGYMAYRSRNVPTDFQEGYWISLAVAFELQLLLLGIPIVLAVRDTDLSTLYLTVSLIIIIMNSTLTVLIFGPKMVRVYQGKDVTIDSPVLLSSNASKNGSSNSSLSKVNGTSSQLLTSEDSKRANATVSDMDMISSNADTIVIS